MLDTNGNNSDFELINLSDFVQHQMSNAASTDGQLPNEIKKIKEQMAKDNQKVIDDGERAASDVSQQSIRGSEVN